VAKRCLIVSYYFPPLGGGGVQRILKLIKYGSRQGWRFTVITAKEKAMQLPADPSLSSEIPADVKIIYVNANLPGEAVGAAPAKMKSTYWKRWISAFLYVPDMRKRWLPGARKAILSEISQEKYDCLLLTSPPFSLAMLAGELSGRLPLPVVLDMRDHWTSYPFKIHPTAWHYKHDCRLEQRAISRVRFGVSAYQSLLEYYRQNIPHFDPARWTLIPNGYDEEDFRDLPHKPLDKRFFKLAFFGTFYSHINHPELLFRALAHLKENAPQAAARLRFYHIGFSHVDLAALSAKYGIGEQVLQLGYLPHKEALGVLQDMDAFSLILDDTNPKSGHTIGAKVYEYLRLKKPVLAMVDEQGEAAALLRRTDSGVVIPPHHTAAVAETLRQWIETPPHFTFKHIEAYSRERLSTRFLSVLEEAALSSGKMKRDES